MYICINIITKTINIVYPFYTFALYLHAWYDRNTHDTQVYIYICITYLSIISYNIFSYYYEGFCMYVMENL